MLGLAAEEIILWNVPKKVWLVGPCGKEEGWGGAKEDDLAFSLYAFL